MHKLSRIKIGYVPMSADLSAPGDRRRFVHFARRLGILFEIANQYESYDLVVVTQRADLSVWCKYAKGKVIFDIPDAYMHEEQGFRSALRGLGKFVSGQNLYLHINYRDLLQKMASRADAVICSTSYDKEFYERLGCKSWSILDSAYEFSSIRKTQFLEKPSLNILWEGLPESIKSFSEIECVLNDLNEKKDIHIRLLTNLSYSKFLGSFYQRSSALESKRYLRKISHEIIPWSVESLKKLVQTCDLSVVPMHSSKLYFHKPPNRTIFFMKMGMPVLGGLSRAHRELADRVSPQFYCKTPGEWKDKLLNLSSSVERRRGLSETYFQSVNEQYSDDSILSAWAGVLDSTLDTSYFKQTLASKIS